MAKKPDKAPPKHAKAAVAAQFAEADAKAQPDKLSDTAFEELQAVRSVRGW